MPESWYECVQAGTDLTQGDFVLDCPVVAWKAEHPVIEIQEEVETISQLREIVKIDVIIMTQACDLEQHKVDEIVVCPIYPLSEFKSAWEERRQQIGQSPTNKAWQNQCEDIRNGFAWNYSMLSNGEVDSIGTEHRIVDFHNIYTLPIEFLTGVAAQRGRRLRLRAPYREHLSQAFARYFMRVGLPSGIEKVW